MRASLSDNKRPPLLDSILSGVARRYRVPARPALSQSHQDNNAASTLAIAIEEARTALARKEAPDKTVKHRFLESLARIILDAMRTEEGDPAFQAMVLQHQTAHVREYASLAAHADKDRRTVRSAVNAVAHPAKQGLASSRRQAEALAQLHELASSSSWKELAEKARHAVELTDIADDPSLARGIARVRDEAALERLQRLKDLEPDELVQRYLSLRDRNGPRSGSTDAAAQGSASRRRGAEVEALAAQAIQALALRLDRAEGSTGSYRVATSLRVPASIPGNAERAKSEWDVVLLRKAEENSDGVDKEGERSKDSGEDRENRGDEGNSKADSAWDVLLLVEAKASVDAATTDLPRLLRGLRLLSHADGDTAYSFEAKQGTIRLRGASLCAVNPDEAGSQGNDKLRKTVLYFCDAPAEATPRILSSATRMQLLSAPASLAFAGKQALGQDAGPQDLEPVWQALLESPRWFAVLHQYQALHQVRELMVHADDLMAAIQQ
ncbi:3-deoxy-D-arabino-heptulosonate 7-phosphate synthase [Pusillimonas sp.]|uniref:3-deoxy-D-arabino-heptulosonate 7-phosphate synthase n=1 Tax=Pusillimonas sp. TaxID=3040095 RepID=UPI0029B40555|nr:3-deoxy-D-arabino-heptulosonate 7-phosphate synthase [Pusillimonas sp.]MDX3895120.1 3-deoxy-D-arabino-heptulosonate 7-phosphate synthase [Pusillimonas sp.]